MGIFSKKKEIKGDFRQLDAIPSPNMPEFPDVPEDFDDSGLNSYEPTISDIKNEVGNIEDIDVPAREYKPSHKMATDASGAFEGLKLSKQSLKDMPSFNDEKPLFVKVTNYKEALRHLDALKTKIQDAENILRELDNVRGEEERKIEAWRKDLKIVKEKLMAVDKNLFEV